MTGASSAKICHGTPRNPTIQNVGNRQLVPTNLAQPLISSPNERTNMNTQPPAPDWYPDPSGKPGLMYWDGRRWHKDIPAAAPPPEPASTTPRRPRQAVVIALLAAVFGLVITVGVVSYLLIERSHRPQTAAPQPPSPIQTAQSPQSSSGPALQTTPSTQAAPASQYFRTPWGTICRVTRDRSTCQNCSPGEVISNAYTCPDPAPAIAVNAAGTVDKSTADIGSSSDIQQLSDGQIYHADGWTVVPRGGWVRFINDTTGHGMAVAGQNFDSF